MKSLLRGVGRIAKPQELAMLVIGLIALALISASIPQHRPLGSVEVKFTDASAHGLGIVPASCPSNPHYAGECTIYAQASYGPYAQASYTSYTQGAYYTQASYAGSCPSSATCADATTLRYTSGSCEVTDVPCPSHWMCSSGSCVPPASADFVAFTAYDGNGLTFAATGHLQARPSLVRPGATTQLYWNVANAESCTITGTNGDSWTVVFSGDHGVASRPIMSQVTYTLTCNSYAGATTPQVYETAIVNVVPIFREI